MQEIEMQELFPEEINIEPQIMAIDQLPVLPADPSPQLLRSVQRYGVVVPITVYRSKEGGWVVVDGRRRLSAARQAGLSTIPVRILGEGGLLSPALSVALNAVRSNNPAAELEAIQKLTEAGLSEREIFQVTGMPVGTIRRRLKLLKLIPELTKAFRDGKVGPGVAEKAAMLPKATQEELYRIYQKKGRITMADLREVQTARRQAEISSLLEGLPEAPEPSPVKQLLYRAIEEEESGNLGSLRKTLEKALDMLG